MTLEEVGRRYRELEKISECGDTSIRDYEAAIVEMVALMNRDDVREQMTGFARQAFEEFGFRADEKKETLELDERAWIVPEGFGEVQGPSFEFFTDRFSTKEAVRGENGCPRWFDIINRFEELAKASALGTYMDYSVDLYGR